MAGTKRVDVAVIGGGILGTSLAYHLGADQGQSVALFERGTLAQGASGKAAGIISAQCWNDWDVRVIEDSRKEYRRLSEENERGIYEEVGGMRIASTPENVELLKRQLRRLHRGGVEGRIIDPSKLKEHYSTGTFDGVRSALYTPHDAVVSPTDLTTLYWSLAAESGAVSVTDAERVTIKPSGGSWEVSAGSQGFHAGKLVIACGAWSKKVLAGLGYRAPLAPYITRACLLNVAAEGGFPYLHDSESDVYLRPFPGRDVLLGDGTELKEVDPDRVPEPDHTAFLENVQGFLARRFPAWAEAPLESVWWGVCTSTPDRRPLVGPVPGKENLFVATGLNGYGVMRAGAIAKRLAGGVASGRFHGLEPCAPSRFKLDEPDFEPRPGFTLE